MSGGFLDMRRNVKHFENIYELWYEWLKTIDPSQWAESAKDTLVDCEMPFAQWWEAHKQFFLPFYDLTSLWVIENEDDYKIFHDSRDTEGELIVAFNTAMPTSAIIKAVRKLLNERDLTHRVGRPAFDDSGADLFELDRRPDEPTIRTLNTMFRIYKAWLSEKEKPKNQQQPLWAIGVQERVVLSQIPAEGDTAKTISDKRKVLTATVSRYLRWAKTLRGNLMDNNTFPRYKS
jgi:hypothetical protein